MANDGTPLGNEATTQYKVDNPFYLHNSDHLSLLLRKLNSSLISGIINALSKEIARGFLFADDVKDLWEDIREGFDTSNRPRIYEIRRDIYRAKQGGDSVPV
ncbi:hypothetical protein LIER_40840 [Lithospermum erythrorhizon]|uniref:Uncharacterized protein n=1 Tax=Lithospermum erythrorhizon TaxID=34254 RepID=A0AAV3R1U2_LITER